MLMSFIDYFTKLKSNVCIASLDISKAYDSVSLSDMLGVMMRESFRRRIIDLMLNWYPGLDGVIKGRRGGSFSSVFCSG